jgi:hypothetical protein
MFMSNRIRPVFSRVVGLRVCQIRSQLTAAHQPKVSPLNSLPENLRKSMKDSGPKKLNAGDVWLRERKKEVGIA